MFKYSFRRVGLAGVSLLLLGSLSATAQERCQHRIWKAERNLHNAVLRHGEHSRQAEKRRRELEHARASCRL